jgi:hypothetical protein
MERFFSFWLHPSEPHFDQLVVGGVFNLTHLLLTFILSLIGVMIYRFLISLNKEKRQHYFQGIAIFLLILEAIRMLWNVLAADGWYAKDVWPLYTCGIFVIIFPLYAFNTPLKKWTEGFIALGAMLAGVVFLIFPSTGLAIFPLWHLNTIISSIMHVMMTVIGAIFFFDTKRQLKRFDFYTAMLIVFIFAGISFVYNILDSETNFFFIKAPFAETPLQLIFDWFGQPWYGISIVLLHVLEGLMMYVLHQRFIYQA